MVANILESLWMTWLAGALAGAAVAGLAVAWWRRRRAGVLPDASIRIEPLVSPKSSLSALKLEKPFMPPPAPIAAAPDDRHLEKRALFRRVGNAVMIQVGDVNEEHRPFNAWVIDRSRQGLRFAAERELAVGRLYSVRPVQATPTTPWCAVEVRHCSETDGHWEVGCRFLLPPPIQVMMLFG